MSTTVPPSVPIRVSNCLISGQHHRQGPRSDYFHGGGERACRGRFLGLVLGTHRTAYRSLSERGWVLCQGDMRNALNSLQATHAGFAVVNDANVFKVVFASLCALPLFFPFEVPSGLCAVHNYRQRMSRHTSSYSCFRCAINRTRSRLTRY